MQSERSTRHDALAHPVTAALLAYLLEQRTPARAPVVRSELALSPHDFALALRSLVRMGLVRRVQDSGDASGPASLNRHLFIQATEGAHKKVRANGTAATPK